VIKGFKEGTKFGIYSIEDEAERSVRGMVMHDWALDGLRDLLSIP